MRRKYKNTNPMRFIMIIVIIFTLIFPFGFIIVYQQKQEDYNQRKDRLREITINQEQDIAQIYEEQEVIYQQQEYFKIISYIISGVYFLAIIVLLMKLKKWIWTPYVEICRGMEGLGLMEDTTGQETSLISKSTIINERSKEMFHRINLFLSLNENLNNNTSFMEILDFINQNFSEYIPYNYIGISLLEEDDTVLKASYGVSDGSIHGLPENIVGYSWPLKGTSLHKLLENGAPRVINDLEEYIGNENLTPYNKIIYDAGIRASVTLPLCVSGNPVGVIFFSSKNKNVYHEGHIKFLKSIANSVAISLNQKILIDDILYGSALALAKLAETRDEDTGDHLKRMKKYSRMIAEMLFEAGMFVDVINLGYIELIERYSPLHDIGKVAIRDDILLKPGKLTVEEFDEMKQHAIFGGKVLRSAERKMQKRGNEIFRIGIEIAEGHHERWDGSGYPMGLIGNEIPLSARIVTIADVFDALTSKRPYKKPYSLEQTFKIMEEGRATQFDPVILDVFLNNRDRVIEKYNELR